MVEEALFGPEKKGEGYSHKIIAYKSLESKRIKVVYKAEDDKLVVISVMWD
jgi:hypothetical protein